MYYIVKKDKQVHLYKNSLKKGESMITETEKKQFLRRLYETEEIVVGGDTVVAIHETIEDNEGSTFIVELFLSLRKLPWSCFETREKITDFCREHPDKLSKNSTFSLYEEKGKPVVVRMQTNNCFGIMSKQYPFYYPFIWRAGDRIVVVLLPQHAK